MIKELLVRANEAVRSLSTLDDDRINEVLRAVACRLRQSEAEILRRILRIWSVCRPTVQNTTD